MPRIPDKVSHFSADICTTWHSFSMWNESFSLSWAKKFYKAHQSPVYLIALIRVSRNALDVFLTAGIFAVWLSNGFEFSLAWNLMSINDAYCYARHLGSQSLLFPSMKMHPVRLHPLRRTHLEGTATIHCVHVKASVCMFPVQWVASSHFLETLACYLIASAAKQGLKFYPLWPCTIHWQVDLTL